ncbi:MAG TPA: complex I subunit 5 family protein [Nocardioidaceae bacterium]|nr:complex I subunit 5 family protein [Nocardioidaceae bacterium]
MTDPAALLPLSVAFPVIGAVLAPALGRWSGKAALGASLAALGGSMAVLAYAAPAVYGGRVLVENLGNWHPVHGTQLGVTFAADAFGMTFALLVACIGSLLLLYTFSSLGGLGSKELSGYACLFQLLLAALIAGGLTADALNLFVWFEVAALASYGLTGFFLERPIALEAGFKIMVLTNMASFLVFIAVLILYRDHGALNFGQLRTAFDQDGLNAADLAALAFMVAGFGTKAGLIPFHGWLPDAHTAAPGPVSALFSGLMVALGIVGISRFAYDVFPLHSSELLRLLTALGCVSAILGAVLALAQDDLKRLLAYDTVSQMGVLLVACGTGSLEGLTGMVYHLMDHALFKTLLFLCAGSILHATGMTKLSEMGALARHRPVTTTAFVVASLAIAGIPPMNGYVSLGLIHHSVEVGHHYVAFSALVVAQVVTVAALGRAAYLAFFRRRTERYESLERPNFGMYVAFGLLAAGCVAFGAAPSLVLDHVATPAAVSLINGRTYAVDALGTLVRMPHETVPFHFFDPTQVGEVIGTVVLGGLLAAWYVRREREPRAVSWLRALHNGSVNDYASWAVAGTLVVLAVLVWA